MANSPEMRSYEDLKHNESIQSDENLRKLTKEIDEIKDGTNKADDKIDGVFAETTENAVDRVLDEGLKKTLENQDFKTLQILVGEIGKISRDSSLNLSEDVKKSVDDLLKLMLQVLEQKRNQLSLEESEQEKKLQKKSFDDFKSLIENNHLDDLNDLDDKDIDNVVKFVQDDNNKGATFDLYYKMQNADFPDNFRRTDRRYFNQVKNAIKEKYKTELVDLTSETVGNVNLLEVFKDKQKAEDLNNLAKEYLGKENWNGEKLDDNEGEGKFPEGKLFKREDFIVKFNEINDKRISVNNGIIENINLAVSEEEMKKFTIEDGILKYDGQEFNQEKMLQQFGDLINPELDKGDFIGNEKADITTKIYEKISTKIKEDLGNSDTDDVNQEISGDQRDMSDTDFKAMEDLLKDGMFIEKGNDGKISYNPKKAKNYLSSLRDTEWKDFKGKFGTPEGRAWVSAVQILLNAEEGDKIKVDGKFGSETKNRVIAFQEKYNQNKPEGTVDLVVDGFPGKNTLAVLLDGKIGDTIFEDGLGHIENGRIVFDNIQEQTDADGRKFIEVEGKKYYEYRDGMTGLGYESGITNNVGYLFMGEYDNGEWVGKGKIIYAGGDKYEGNWENGSANGQGIYTWSGGNSVEGNWVNGGITDGAITLKSSGVKLNATRNSTTENWRITSEGEYKDRIINYKTGKLEGVGNGGETPLDNGTIDEIDVNGISGTVEGVGKFENGKFTFVSTIEQGDDDLGHYVKFGGEQYHEYKDGMDGKGYRVVSGNEGQVMFGNFKAGKLNGEAYVMGIGMRVKFENVTDDVANGKGVVEFKNGNIIQGERKDNNFVEGKYMVKETGIIYDVASDETGLKIVSEGENNGKYIDTKTGDIKIQTVEA